MQDLNETTEIKAFVTEEIRRQIGEARKEIDQAIAEVRERTVDDRATIVVFSGDLDKAIAAMVIATGAASAGLQTSLFFTFWGLSLLKKKGAARPKHGIKEKMFSLMTPSSSESLGVSQMNYFGMGSKMLRSMMKDKDIASLEELFDMARDLDVKMLACTMSMDAMGIEKEELVSGLEYGGAAAYLADAASSRVTLFI